MLPPNLARALAKGAVMSCYFLFYFLFLFIYYFFNWPYYHDYFIITISLYWYWIVLYKNNHQQDMTVPFARARAKLGGSIR